MTLPRCSQIGTVLQPENDEQRNDHHDQSRPERVLSEKQSDGRHRVNSLLIGATLYNENRPIEAADYSVPGGNEVFLHFFTRKCGSRSLAAAVAMTIGSASRNASIKPHSVQGVGKRRRDKRNRRKRAPSLSFSSDEPKRQSFDLTVSGIQSFMAVFVFLIPA
jgi:hypothetical protein